MNLRGLSNKRLMFNAKNLVRYENRVLVQILHHIMEMDRRRLHAEYKLPSLLDLVMKELGYSRDMAIRRIQAMRMMRELPVVGVKLENGEMTLTSVGIVQVLFSAEKKAGKPLSREQKCEVIENISGKSCREVQKIVLSQSSNPHKVRERIRMIAPDVFELVASIDEETVLLIEKLKGMVAHSHPQISNGELIKMLGKIGEAELVRVKPVVSPRLDSEAEVRRQVWDRDQDKCTNCGSTYAVEEDHILPKAMGGAYTLENMRLLCRSCNQHSAIRHFGAEKMNQHFRDH